MNDRDGSRGSLADHLGRTASSAALDVGLIVVSILGALQAAVGAELER